MIRKMIWDSTLIDLIIRLDWKPKCKHHKLNAFEINIIYLQAHVMGRITLTTLSLSASDQNVNQETIFSHTYLKKIYTGRNDLLIHVFWMITYRTLQYQLYNFKAMIYYPYSANAIKHHNKSQCNDSYLIEIS